MWGIIILVVVIVVVVNIIRGLNDARNEATLDENGDMRCKGCGGRNFMYERNSDGSITYECAKCGKRWTRY